MKPDLYRMDSLAVARWRTGTNNLVMRRCTRITLAVETFFLPFLLLQVCGCDAGTQVGNGEELTKYTFLAVLTTWQVW